MTTYFWRIHKIKSNEILRILKIQKDYWHELTGEDKEYVANVYSQIGDLIVESGLLTVPETQPVVNKVKRGRKPKNETASQVNNVAS